MSDHSSDDPMVLELAYALRDVRESAMVASASINALPGLMREFEKRIQDAAKAEQRILDMMEALEPASAAYLRVHPCLSESPMRTERYYISFRDTPEVRALRSVVEEDVKLSFLVPAPPVRTLLSEFVATGHSSQSEDPQ